MKVILAGYSKTGTKSLCEAFHILGYNTYDFLEHSYYHYKEWTKIITKGSTVEDFRLMYEGVDAVTDMPSFYFWEQIHEAFPDAKIILTERDEDKWYKSFRHQMETLNNSFFVWFTGFFSPSVLIRNNFRYHMFKLMGDVASFPSNKLTLFSDTLLKNMYRRHNAYVKQKAPKDKLLIYEVSQGWKPLCEFLGEEIPDQPFPHKNKGSSVFDELKSTNKVLKIYITQAITSGSIVAVLMCFMAWWLWSVW